MPFNPNNSGVQRTTFKLGKYFTENGHLVRYYSTAFENQKVPQYGELYHSKEAGGTANKNNIAELQSIILTIQPDIIINQMPYDKDLRKALYLIKKEMSVPLLACLRNSLFSFKSNVAYKLKLKLPSFLFLILNNPVVRRFVLMKHKRMHTAQLKDILDLHDKFILLAPPNFEELKYFVGNYKSEKITYIPNSIPEVYPSYIEKKEKIILHVGSLNDQQKRADILLPFWKEVYRDLPEWKFIILGEGKEKQKIEQEIKEKDIPRIFLEGHKASEPYYAKASIFMMPSAYEGFPNTILEAQSHGCPVLAFNSYLALDWIVSDRKDAMLSPPFNLKDMAENAITMANDGETLNSMQYAALQNAQRFTIDKVGRQWIKFFNEIT